jgi:3-dehydroquinate dehydratase/shikimate dehydrogenase
MKTLLAVPVAAEKAEEAVALAKSAAAAGAGIVELRVDYLDGLSAEITRNIVKKTRAAAKLPVIVTCRDKVEGGAKPHADSFRVEVLTAALAAGAEFVDFEYERFRSPAHSEALKVALARNPAGRLILSAHSFQGPFENMPRLYRRMGDAWPAAVPKLVYTAGHINDCFQALDMMRNVGGPKIVFCMGQAGLATRVLAAKFGCFLTFASLHRQGATAPGQPTAAELRGLYRFDSIGPETALYGVIGSPVAHSASPAAHNACLAKAGIDAVYLPLPVDGGAEQFDGFMRGVLARKWLGFRGFSVTIPHKENALAFVKASGGEVEPLAERIGAANTIVIGPGGRLNACNTDYAAAVKAATAAMGMTRAGLRGVPVAVIGAGGAARAIVAGFADAGSKVTVYNRTVSRGEKLAAEFACGFRPLADLKGSRRMDARIVVNCTSVGMHPDTGATPVPAGALGRGMVVFDTVYNPPRTQLLKDAAKVRAKRIDGLSMFVNQAMAQFRLFTARRGNAAVMRRAAKALLTGR